MKAVVMAGGVGSRLRPLTNRCPKPMVPFINKPVLAHTLDLLKRHNFTEIVITVQHLAEQIQDYFGDGTHLGLNIEYAVERTPLGTAGSVKNAQHLLGDDPFLVISGDAVTDVNLSRLVETHQRQRATATIAVKTVSDPSQYGVVVTNADGSISRFVEKPKLKRIFPATVNTGIYVLEPEVLDLMQPQTMYDFSYDIFPRLLKEQQPFYTHQLDNYWCDIGTIESYMQATQDALAGAVNHIDLGNHLGGGVWAGGDVDIAPDVKLSGPIYLGKHSKLNRGVTIQGPAVVLDYSVIDRGAHIESSIIGRNCLVGRYVKVKQAIVPPQCNLMGRVNAFHQPSTADLAAMGPTSAAWHLPDPSQYPQCYWWAA